MIPITGQKYNIKWYKLEINLHFVVCISLTYRLGKRKDTLSGVFLGADDGT